MDTQSEVIALHEIRSGESRNGRATEQLLPLVYDLRRIGRTYLKPTT